MVFLDILCYRLVMKYEPVIGLEIHAELNTKTKMFCYSPNDPNEEHPNTNICPVCLGHPGTLPMINRDAVDKVIQVGLALHGEIPEFSQFDRKNYFYPDLPKGYQISQYEHPLVNGGYLEILSQESRIRGGGGSKRIQIRRIHLEEDTGRIIHDQDPKSSLIDFNRAGVPLMELVTEPDFRIGDEVKQFGEALQRILRYLGASDANMEKGQMRVEVNISMRPVGAEELGTKVEVKNINSFRYAADAVEYETNRQTALLERGESVLQETRGWDERKHQTFSQRSKEEAHDYRYFPEPDLPLLRISRSRVEALRAELPELPQAKRERFGREFGIDVGVSEVLTRDKALAGYYEAVVSETRQHDKETPERPKKNLAKLAAAFMTGDFLRILNMAEAAAYDTLVTPENFAELVHYVSENRISNIAAKTVLEEMFRSGSDPSDIIERLGLWQMSDPTDIEDMARHILKEYPSEVASYRGGKAAVLQFLVGQVMKESRGKANPTVVQEVIQKLLRENGTSV